jgi:hypothetical protein
MGAYCTLALIPRHTAKVGEVIQVLWSDYHGAALFGDRQEIACIPHKGCRLEIVATAETSHREVDLLLPGQVLRYKRAFFIFDRFELPSGVKVGLWHFVGFKLRLAPAVSARQQRSLDDDSHAHQEPASPVWADRGLGEFPGSRRRGAGHY